MSIRCPCINKMGYLGFKTSRSIWASQIGGALLEARRWVCYSFADTFGTARSLTLARTTPSCAVTATSVPLRVNIYIQTVWDSVETLKRKEQAYPSVHNSATWSSTRAIHLYNIKRSVRRCRKKFDGTYFIEQPVSCIEIVSEGWDWSAHPKLRIA